MLGVSESHVSTVDASPDIQGRPDIQGYTRSPQNSKS